MCKVKQKSWQGKQMQCQVFNFIIYGLPIYVFLDFQFLQEQRYFAESNLDKVKISNTS